MPFHFCNICNENVEFTNFLYRRYAKCPKCGSLERHRSMAIHIWPLLPVLHGKRVLHFAPEGCLKTILASIPCEYTGINFNPKTNSGDIRNMPYADDTFDLILANQILEHVDDDNRAISELHRVLKKEGTALLTVPLIHQYHQRVMRRTDGSFMDHIFDLPQMQTYAFSENPTPNECFKWHGQRDHLRIYGMADLKDKLMHAGFMVSISSPACFPLDFTQRLGVIDDVFILRK